MNPAFSHLFTPGQIGRLHLKNRIIAAPVVTQLEEQDGYPRQEQLAFYAHRAKNGFAMQITDAQYVTNKTDRWLEYLTIADSDIQLKAWSQMAEAVGKNGGRLCIQLSCGFGRLAFPFDDNILVSASANRAFYFPDLPCRPLSTGEVEEIVDAFARAGRRAKLSGADAIEIHAASGFLIDQFMTPIWNRRDDRYGGSFEGRMAFLKEILLAIRGETGPSFPLLVRYSVTHDFEGGRTLAEGIEIAKYLEQLGIDGLNIVRGAFEAKHWIIPTVYAPDSCTAQHAAEIKKAVALPVLHGGAHTPESAEAALSKQMMDFALFARPALADPELPGKLASGRHKDIRPCIRCNEICTGRYYQQRVVSCSVNPLSPLDFEPPADSFGRFKDGAASRDFTQQAEMPKSPQLYFQKGPLNKKRVVVIGGGPAGMEAARVAAEMGHQVVLYESAPQLGGQLILSSALPFKGAIRAFLQWQLHCLNKLPMEIHVNEAIREYSPALKHADALILALGAKPKENTVLGETRHLVKPKDVFLQPDGVPGNTAVVIGGGIAGCECALYLAMKGKSVTLVEKEDRLIPYMIQDNRNHLMRLLRENQVTLLTGHTLTAFTGEGILISSKTGASLRLAADAVIPALGCKSESKLADRIRQKYPNARIIGDCKAPGLIGHAVRDAFQAVLAL